MAHKMFARGYEASRKEKERQDRQRENAGNRLWRFFLAKDGDEADVRFLTEEPVNFYEHNLKDGDRYVQYCCTGEDCVLCQRGERATYKGAYLIIDRRPYEYKDKQGNTKKGKDQVRLYVQGMKVVSQLDRISSKYGLSNRDVTIIRLGSGTQTTYTIERGEQSKLTAKEVENILPDNLRDLYDGTTDSLMDIIEKQLIMSQYDYEEEEDESDVNDASSKVISYDDEEEEELSFKEEETKSSKRLFKKPQHSLKKHKTARDLLK